MTNPHASQVIAYQPLPAAVPLATFMLRGWAVVNWFCTLLAIGLVTAAFIVPRFPMLSVGDSFAGIVIMTLGGCIAVGSTAWGAACWRLGSAVAACNEACTRIARSLNLLLGIGCAVAVVAVIVLRQRYGPLHWTGMEGWAWRVLLSATSAYILATLLTYVILWRAGSTEPR